MSNLSPCGSCHFYDPILRGTKERKMGWCAKKSVYAAYRDDKTAPLPEGAKTAATPVPVIVKKDEVKLNCTDFQAAGPKPNKADQLVAAITDERDTTIRNKYGKGKPGFVPKRAGKKRATK